jgi:hypothetical protein
MPYPAITYQRALQAVRCSPFCLPLFAAMQERGVALAEITGIRGVENQFTKVALNELSADGRLGWLIQVGLLRREVDGQGLTDSFRLTPLGRELLEKWQTESWTTVKPLEQLQDLWRRMLNLSFG